jgi:cytochrome P450
VNGYQIAIRFLLSYGYYTNMWEQPAVAGTDSEATIPQASGWPVVGNAPRFLADPVSFFDSLQVMGDLVDADLPFVNSLAVYHPTDVQYILTNDEDVFERWNWQEALNLELVPQGLISVEGDVWRRQRRLLQSMFRRDHLARFDGTIRRHVTQQVSDWHTRGTVELGAEFAELSLSILTESLLDIDIRTRGSTIDQATSVLNDRVQFTLLGAIEMFLPDWIPTGEQRRYRQAMAEFDEMVTELIAERRAHPDAHEDLLSTMLEETGPDGAGLSDDVIRDQVLAFLFAGQDTTAAALTFAVQLFAANPDVQTKVQDEVDTILNGAALTADTLDELTYTEHVIREALRLYPPTAILFRRATQSTRLGDTRIPADTKLLIPQFSIHTDSRWYDHPKAFWPERWVQTPPEDRHDYSYLPFGGGPHHCIGMRFAMMELKYTLAIIAHRLDIELVSAVDPDVEIQLSMHPAKPVVIRGRSRR